MIGKQNLRLTGANSIEGGNGRGTAAFDTRRSVQTGQVSMDAEGRLVAPGDFSAQARQVYVNLRKVEAIAVSDNA